MDRADGSSAVFFCFIVKPEFGIYSAFHAGMGLTSLLCCEAEEIQQGTA